MIVGILLVGTGLIVLTYAADRFVLAAARLAALLGLSPILIGALVLGMGTSAPELSVGVQAGLSGRLDLAVGAVIGSNIANLTLVLGTSVLIATMAGQARTIRREGVLMVAAVTLFGIFVWGGALTRWHGLVLAAGMVGAASLLVRWARADIADDRWVGDEVAELTAGDGSVRRELFFAVVGLVATVAGADLLVRGADRVADALGLSQGFIGLTLVAVGTSLPELATAVAAARRLENDLVIGNLLGSNLFNSLAVAGGAALAGPATLGRSFDADVAIMVAVAVAAAFMTFTGNRLVRAEGVVLLTAYVAFLSYSWTIR